MGGRPDGNRQDNRQRGNAAQLLEKYKSLARDAQLAGDRVQTEYYLQFADHYFRVLSESRARFEEQRPQRGEDFEDEGSDEDQYDGDGEGSDEEVQQQPEQQNRQNRQPRRDREDRGDRQQRDRPRRYARDDNGEDRPSRNERSQDDGRETANVETLPFDALPPAIGIASAPAADDEAEERPRRRTRRPRPASDEGEIAPAA